MPETQDDDRKLRIGLVIGAGAPHSPLMAGALCALLEAGKKFKVVYTSGAGALVGLLYKAPAGGSATAALRRIVDLGVAEYIYDVLPVGYKAFYKAGPWTRLFRQWAQASHIREYHPSASPITIPSPYPGAPPIPIPVPSYPNPAPMPFPAGWFLALWWHWISHWLPYHGSPGPGHPPLDADAWRRLYNDWIDLWFSLWTPTTLNYESLGLCDPLPFLEEMVDVGALSALRGRFFVNAYSISRHKLVTFGKDSLTPQHIRAALAMPFIYPPAEVGGEMYYEGADREPLPVEGPDFDANVVNPMKDVDKVLVLDVLSQLESVLMRVPQNIWDAYVISVITPIVSLALKARPAFEEALRTRRKVVKTLPFEIPADAAPHILEWRHSNLVRLWNIGHAAGRKFLHDPFWNASSPTERSRR